MTVDIPAWVTEVPNYPVHTEPSRAGGDILPPFTWQQMQEYFSQFMAAFIRKVALALGGIFVPGWDGYEYLVDWALGVANILGLGSANGFIGPLDLEAIWTDITEGFIQPLEMFAELVDGLISEWQIPFLDASKIATGLFPQDMVENLEDDLSGLWDAIASGDPDAIIEAITGIIGGTTDDLENWSDNLQSMLGLPDLNDAVFDAIGAVETFILDLIHPNNLLAPMDPGTLLAFPINIPFLDASKIDSGTFDDSFVPGLLDRLLTTVFAGSSKAGTNLMLSPTFDDSSIVRFPYGAPASRGYTTAQKHSGTQSYFWESPNFWAGIFLAPNETDAYLVVQPGEKYYLEAWVYPKATNTTSPGYVSLGCSYRDSAGVLSNQFSDISVPISSLPLSTWTKITKHLDAVPTGYDQLWPALQNQDIVPAGNIYYVDDVVIREETQEQGVIGNLFGTTSPLSAILATAVPFLDTSKILTGTFADSFVPGLTDRLLSTIFTDKTVAGSNLIIDPSLRDTTIPRPGNGTYSTDQAHSYTHSLKLTGASAWEAIEFNNHATATSVWGTPQVGIKVAPDQRFYGEVWVRPHASNTKPAPGVFMQLTIVDSRGIQPNSVVTMAGSFTPLPAGTWTKLSGYATIPPGYDAGNLTVQLNDASALGDTYYFDDPLLREETQSQNIIENLVTKLFGGLTGQNYTVPDAAAALLNTNSQIAANAAAIQALATNSNSQRNSGVGATVRFADYTDGALPAAFTVNYSLSGTSTQSVIGGQIRWTTGNSSDRQADNLYNALQTLTDYQIVGTSWAYGPENYFGASQARSRIICRSNSAGTSFVYLDIWTSSFDWYFELGCVVSGTPTVMKSATQFASGYGGVSSVSLAAGTTGGQRIFQIYSGNNVVYTHTEVGTTSQVGSTFRYTGFGGLYKASAGNEPGTVNSFSMSDNVPPTTVGSGFNIYRNSTGAVTPSTGNNLFGNSFFDTELYRTSDWTIALGTNNKATCSIAGWYAVTLCFLLNGDSTLNYFSPVLYKNGSVYRRGINIPAGNEEHLVGMTWGAIYLAVGDYIQPGYHANGTGTQFIGDASGANTYFGASLTNRSTT